METTRGIGLPLFAIYFQKPLILSAYFIDLPAILWPNVIKAGQRKEIFKASISLPCFFILRTVNGLYMLEAQYQPIFIKETFEFHYFLLNNYQRKTTA